MNRIDSTFAELRKASRKALIGYLTAGDPDMGHSESDMRCALENGVDILEIGLPFSDPTADGPVIQAAGRRALDAGATFETVLEMAARLRRDFQAPMILFSYANPMFRRGYVKTAREAADAGLDAVLAVDIPFEESAELKPHLDANGLYLIQLVAPTTTEARMKTILADARGFVYYIMVRGVTGERTSIPADMRDHIALLRRHTDLPVAAGFGVGTAEQAAAVAAIADAVVAGSALVAAARNGTLPVLVRKLASAVHG